MVGAGPTGLLVAIELAMRGFDALVLERLGTASAAMKAKSIGPLAAEALQRRGMTAALAAEEERSFALIQQFIERNGPDDRGRGSKLSGHFAGLPVPKSGRSDPKRRACAVAQEGLEAILAERARGLGIEVRRECDVTGFVQQADGVDVTWESPAGEAHARCCYLVGCDGAHSFVRKSAGFDFPGTAPTATLYQAIVDLDYPERLLPNGWNRTPGGVFSYGPLPGRLVMIDFTGPPADREVPVTREEIEAGLRRVSGRDVRVKALESAGRWADNTRLVDTYRRGRVLLAGDAAHIHSPFGGQGLSLGLVDAVNLGWKLAAVVRGDIGESLLDTYTAERRPVAEAVLANTLAQIAALRPDPQSGALRDIIAKLLTFEDVGHFIGEMTSGLSVRYELGSERDEVGRLIGDKPIENALGKFSLYDLMQDGSGLLLDASEGGRAAKIAAPWTRSVRCVAIDHGPSMLIRPDACIAWAADANSIDGLREALGRWFKPEGLDAAQSETLG